MLGIQIKSKIRVKLIALLVGLAGLPLVLVLLIITVRLQESERENAVRHNRQIAQLAASKIAGFIESQFNALNTIGLTYPEVSRDAEGTDNLIERFLYKAGSFVDLSVLDSSGQEISRKNTLEVISKEDLKNRSESLEFITVREKDYYISPFYLSRGLPFFVLGKSLSAVDGIFRGAVLAQVDARIMQDVVKRVSNSGYDIGRAYIVNREGVVIAHSDISEVLSEKDLSYIPAVSSVIGKSANFNPTDTYLNELQEEVLGSGFQILISFAGGRILDPGWFVIAEQRADVSLRVVTEIARFSLLLFGLTLVLSFVMAIIFARWIVRPIEALYTAAKKFGEGSLKTRVYVKTSDELEVLGNEFNSMAEKLDKSLTDLSNEQRLLSAERNKLSIILAGITDAVIAVDLGRNIILFNKSAERLTGFKSTEVIAKPISQVLRVFDKEKELDELTYCPVKEVTKKEKQEGVLFSQSNLKIFGNKDKESFVNLVSGSIREGKSINLGCILSLHDITREQLVERMKSEFVSIAAHQLRTPLSIIKWSLDMLSEKMEKRKVSKEERELFEQSRQSNERMINLVKDLLDAARIEEGRFLYKPAYVDLQKIIEGIIAAEEDLLKQRNIAFKFVPQVPKIPEVEVDAEAMSLAIQNLIANSRKYTLPGGEINVSLGYNGSEILFSVTDNGIGIPEKDWERVFTKFFRAANAIKLQTEGSGLGLFIAKNIVEAHDGKIWFESKENTGSTFYFSLPTKG